LGDVVIQEQDREIEERLRRYRPAGPRTDLWNQISTFPDFQISKFPRTWPWAMAAAALLALTIGLHAFSSSSVPDDDHLDERRIAVVADDLGGPANRPIAEWIVREETRAERAARINKAESLRASGVPQ
jgi:hypothetical protein